MKKGSKGSEKKRKGKMVTGIYTTKIRDETVKDRIPHVQVPVESCVNSVKSKKSKKEEKKYSYESFMVP